jgi:hypothetical protein
MARWLSIKVELISGRGEEFWPRPGRVIAAAATHTFEQLATAIDFAFARWDLGHLSEFTLVDGSRIGRTEWDDTGNVIDSTRTRLSRLRPGDQFAYEFDFGDGWTHLLSVDRGRIDPLDEFGSPPSGPAVTWGWGDLPDQYGRRFEDDDGTEPVPSNPGLRDLPPIIPGWGSPTRRPGP